MDNYNQGQPFSDYTVVNSGVKPASKTFIANVFLLMFVALGISAFFAFLFSNNYSLMAPLLQQGRGLSTLGYVVMFAPLGFVLLMSLGFNKLSSTAMVLLFLLYSAITGISLSFILLIYTTGSVIGCFASAAAMFGIMAVMGYTTDKDLTSFGRILFMGLIGVVVCMVINFFLGSARLDYIISIIGVMVFTGLTAYDTQVLKRIGAGLEYNNVSADQTKKLSILGALRLYLDFINLFLMLLRLFGRRR